MNKLLKILIALVVFIVIAGVIPQSQALAYSDTAVTSATLTNTLVGVEKSDGRIRTLTLFLDSYDSPLKDYAADFVKSADNYGVDWKLVPAITGVESTFGKFIPQGSYNAYGWANGNFYFQSWSESIDIVTKTLKERYIDKGADTVEKIAPIYAPPSRTWAGKVRYFMDKIENFGNEPQESPSLTLSL